MSNTNPDNNKASNDDKFHKGPIAWMAGHSVAANLIMLACIIGGIIVFRNIQQEVFPDIQIDTVIVNLSYGGASPEEVEDGMILAVEEAVRGLDGVDQVSSEAYEGGGSVVIEALVGADIQRLSNEVQSEVDRITTFPDDAEEPQVTIASIKREVLTAILYGDASESTLLELSEQLRHQLLQEDNITQVDIYGIRDLEISVSVSLENLRRYNLTIGEIAQIIENSSLDLPGGSIKTKGGEILIRMTEKRDIGSEFAVLPVITTSDGVRVLLKDIAVIEDGFEDTDQYLLFNGKRAVELDVSRVGDQTPIEVSDATYHALELFKPYLPEGISVAIPRDRSDLFRQRVDLLLRNGAIGLVLVLCILGLFLEARLAFWVMMGIPISFVGSFLLLPVFGVSINMISLFAYIIALGIVVDDAIVVGENVYHYRQQGLNHLDAAIAAAREVAMPVTFSILTNIATFLPLYFIPGPMGKFISMMPVVVIIVFIISLIESVFVLPAHLAHSKSGTPGMLHNLQQGFSRGFTTGVKKFYGPFLNRVLHARWLTLAVGFSVLAVMLSYAATGRLGMSVMPTVESDFSRASVVFPYGSSVEKAEQAMKRFSQAAQKVIDDKKCAGMIKGIATHIGGGGSHQANMRVFLADAEIREQYNVSTSEFTNLWRQAAGEIVGAENVKFADDFGGPGGRGSAVQVELSHRDMSILDAAGKDLAATLQNYPIVKDVDDGFQPGKIQLDFTITPEGKSMGFTAQSIARSVRNSFYGAEALRQQRGRNELKVKVRLPESQRQSEYDIDNLLLKTPVGGFAPLSEIASVSRGRAYTTISRRDGRRVIQVTADARPRSRAGEVLDDLKLHELDKLVRKYPGLTYSFEGHQADMRDSLGSLKMTFALAMLAIYAMLAIPFRSYTQPLIVMVSIPFGIVGAFIGHILMGLSLSMISMFGIVALAGVVVNDSLVMIDYANRRRRDGLNAFDAVHSAAIQRFRPIMLTTLTTFGGLTPMIFETSLQARVLIPMAVSLGFGILFATGITLVLVPALYLTIDNIFGHREHS